MTVDDSRSIVHELVACFDAGKSHYLSAAYQESEVRTDFIDKFFTALGWDVGHVTQRNPYRQEVKVERRPDRSMQRRADYAFFITPNFRDIRFFVEAKKPSRSLMNADDYFQAARYAWNAGTPLVVLTDFEEFHIIDARAKPRIDTILKQGLRRYHYTDYTDPEKFAEIWHLFSREAVADGAITEFAEALPKPAARKGAATPGELSIDEAFLAELDDIRRTLAKAFKKTNPSWDGELLTEAVQRSIDRLVFMRFLEDKLIEPDRIVATLAASKQPWHDFTALCRRLDARYNGVVFKEHVIDRPDCVPPDHSAFLAVCRELSHERSAYDFNTIPVHILGSVYERFLGRVVRATAKQVVVEDRLEVRKAGGVTYTPQFIVRHIVERTVGRRLDGCTPGRIAGMRFVDIACGSGSFLITMFEHLLDFHRDWYQVHPEQARRDGCAYVDGAWALTLRQKRAILVNNIFGVDLDPQAVEISQLSLYLKLLEDETTATANEMQVLFKEKLLPDLSGNIVAGNSLIGSDIITGAMFTGEEERTLLPLDFETAFPHVMREGGFDGVVGNPPYVRQETLGPKVKAWLRGRYAVAHGTADLYTYFIERGYNLLKPDGLFGYIVANKWMRAAYGEPLRRWMKARCIEEITDFGDLPVFTTVTTYPCLLFLRKAEPREEFRAAQIATLDFERLDRHIEEREYRVSQAMLDDGGWSLADTKKQLLLAKIRAAGIPLGEYVQGKIFYGIKTGLNEAFVIDAATRERLIAEDPQSAEIIKPFLAGRDIKRYEPLKAEKWLIFARRGISIKDHPAIERHLLQYKQQLMPKPRTWKGGEWKGRKPGSYKWYELQDSIDYWQEFEKPKLMLPDISLRGNFALDPEGALYSVNTTYIIQNRRRKWNRNRRLSRPFWLVSKNWRSKTGDTDLSDSPFFWYLSG